MSKRSVAFCGSMASPSPQRLGQESTYLFLVACLPCLLVSSLYLFACLPCLLDCLVTVAVLPSWAHTDDQTDKASIGILFLGTMRNRDGFFSAHATSMPSPQRLWQRVKNWQQLCPARQKKTCCCAPFVLATSLCDPN